MDTELMETFEAARKAADAAAETAAAGGGSADVDRCVDALRQLKKVPVTMKVLVDTQVGRKLRALVKNPEEKIRTLASDLLKHWKNVVIEETSKESKKGSLSQDTNSMKVEVKTERTQTVKVEKFARSGSLKVEKISRSENLKVEKINSNMGVKVEKGMKLETLKIEKSESSVHPVINGSGTVKTESPALEYSKLSKMVKCNVPVRDKVRDLIAEALLRVPKETAECDRPEVKNILDEVDERDPIRIAVIIESAMFERLGPSTGEHKVKYRSIMFNLKDNKNIDFRRRVLLGEVNAEEICDLTPDDMASDERKAANQQIKQKALFECERAAAPKASTDQFKCGRCGQRKATYYQLQTRSADEPMTTFVTCVNCNNHWKFC